MPQYGSKDVFVLVAGYDLTSTVFGGLSEKDVSVVKDSTPFGAEWATQQPTGNRKAEFSQPNAFFDPDTGGAHDALKALPTGPGTLVACHGRAGMVIGRSFIAADPLNRIVPITSSSVANPSIITPTVPHGITNGQLVLIAGHSGSSPDINGEHIATVSGDTFSIPINVTSGGTGGTVVQANTAGGGIGFLHVTAFTGWTGLIVTVRDSPDDITYADLVAFTNVTAAPDAQRKSVNGTIDRYLAIDGAYSGGGPGTSTPFCGFKRKK